MCVRCPRSGTLMSSERWPCGCSAVGCRSRPCWAGGFCSSRPFLPQKINKKKFRRRRQNSQIPQSSGASVYRRVETHSSRALRTEEALCMGASQKSQQWLHAWPGPGWRVSCAQHLQDRVRVGRHLFLRECWVEATQSPEQKETQQQHSAYL